MQQSAPIPVSVLTGFLGAGKTTLLNGLLKSPALANTAVIINEFGDVALDHLLVEQSGEGIIELSDGCLCCSVRGELVDTLADLLARLGDGRIAALDRILVETTGLADPAPVLHALMAHPLLQTDLRLDGVVTVVDAANGAATLDAHEEAVKQAAVADRLILTKTDLADDATIAALKARLARLNPTAPVIDAAKGEFSPASLFECGLYDPATKTADVSRWLRDEALHEAAHGHHHDHDHDHDHDHEHDHHHRHDARIRSFSLVHDRPIDPGAMEGFVDLLRSAHGERLLRMKGIICLSNDLEHPVVLHAVQTIMHPLARLAAWPDPADRRSRLVLITRDLSEDYVRDLFAAFTGEPRVDQPDRAALEDNPLAIPGMKVG